MRRRLPATLLITLVGALALSTGIATAQSPGAPSGVTFTLDPVGTGAVTGLAVLTPRDADTAANLLTVGAPAGAIAVIHAGTCVAIDPPPVGLLGDVGTTGQLSATVPVLFAAVADGTHVVAIHEGLDLATAIACGAIPRSTVDPASTPPPASVAPTAVSTPIAVPSSTADQACAGVQAWVSATLARFDTLKRLADDLNNAMSAGMTAYAQKLADTSLAVQQQQIEQQQVAVPDTAKDAQAAVITMLQKLVEAYDLMAQAYTSGDTGALRQGLGAASEAQGLATSARTALRNVATPCGITVPAA